MLRDLLVPEGWQIGRKHVTTLMRRMGIEAIPAVCDEEVEAFHAWLVRQGRPSNVVDFLAERDKRRGPPPSDSDADR